jgi:hypothetical protein
MDLTCELLSYLSDKVALKYNTYLFQNIFKAAYYPMEVGNSRRPFRFGVAIEWHTGLPLLVKCYFDLYSGGRLFSYTKLCGVIHMLDFTEHLESLESLGVEASDLMHCRTVGIDLSPAADKNIRIYLPGSRFTLRRIDQLLRRNGQSNNITSLDHLNKTILNRISPDQPLRSVLVSLIFAPGVSGERPLLKLDVYLPAYKPDDEASSHSIVALASFLNLTLSSYGQTRAVFAKGQPSGTTQNLQQYLSLDLLPQGRNKINVYFRPFHLQTPHVSLMFLPRMKPTTFSSIDDYIMITIRTLEIDLDRALSTYHSHPKLGTHRGALGFDAGSDPATGSIDDAAIRYTLILDSLRKAVIAGFRVNWDAESCIKNLALITRNELARHSNDDSRPTVRPTLVCGLVQILLVLAKLEVPGTFDLFNMIISALPGADGYPGVSADAWIIDRMGAGLHARGKTPDTTVARWHQGMDVSVAGNLLYAVHLHDAVRFQAGILRGIEYLSSRQTAGGYWQSSAQEKKYQYTYTCARIISNALPEHHALPGVAQFVLRSRGSGDGWGHRHSNVDETAFGLLTATLLRTTIVFNTNIIVPAIRMLINHQSSAGRDWESDFNPMGKESRHRSGHVSKAGPGDRPENSLDHAMFLQTLCAARAALVELEERGAYLPR